MNSTPSTTTLGAAAALLSAASFAANLVMARVAYELGADIHALNLARMVLFAGVCGLWLWYCRDSPPLPKGAARLCLVAGALLALEMYAMLAAVTTIPVSTAVLVFYAYPFMLAAFEWLTGRERPTAWRLAAMLTGFGGIALVLGAARGDLEPAGVAFALLGALGLAGLLIVGERAMPAGYRARSYFRVTLTAALIVSVLSALFFTPVWPASIEGLASVGLSSLLYTAATMLLFVANSIIGPLKTGILDTTSPVWALLLGVLVLGERFTPGQLAGATLVICAVVVNQFIHGRAAIDPSLSP